MTVAFMRWPQCRHDPGRRSDRLTIGNDAIAPPRCEAFNLLHGELVARAQQAEHQQMIMEPAPCAGDHALCVETRGRAID